MNHVRCYVFSDCTRNEFSGHYTVQQAKHYCCYGFLWNSKSVTYNLLFLTWTFQEKKRFDSSGFRIITLSTEKKRLLEMGKNSPPSFKELRQISGSFVQVWTVPSDFWPLCPFLCTSVGFRTLSFDFELFRPISDIIVRFQMAIIRFWIIASVSGHFHPFSNTFRQMLRDHPIACFRPI